MNVSIGWSAVAVASMVGLAIAWVGYSDWGLLGPVWRGLTGVTKEDSVRAGKRPFVVLIVSIVVTAVALALASSVASAAFGRHSLGIDLAVGLAAWLGVSMTTLMQHNSFENKPWRLTVINGAYQLVHYLGMAAAIGLVS